MGSAAPRSKDLAKKSQALADRCRSTGDGWIYAISVASSDGHDVTVTWQLDTHLKECRRYVLREISHQFRVASPEEALEVLTTWTKDELIAHLEKFTREELRPPSMRGPQ